MSDHTITDGDIFRWRYKDEKPSDIGAFRRYHCKSQIAIVSGEWFRDTFWQTSDSPLRYDEAARLLDLTYLGNLHELEKKPEYEADYYDDADCVDINHANSSKGNFYVRKGAVRSREKIRESLVGKISRLESEVHYRQQQLDAARERLAAVESGADIANIYV